MHDTTHIISTGINIKAPTIMLRFIHSQASANAWNETTPGK